MNCFFTIFKLAFYLFLQQKTIDKQNGQCEVFVANRSVLDYLLLVYSSKYTQMRKQKYTSGSN